MAETGRQGTSFFKEDTFLTGKIILLG